VGVGLEWDWSGIGVGLEWDWSGIGVGVFAALIETVAWPSWPWSRNINKEYVISYLSLVICHFSSPIFARLKVS
jgi:hypothetical protein